MHPKFFFIGHIILGITLIVLMLALTLLAYVILASSVHATAVRNCTTEGYESATITWHLKSVCLRTGEEGEIESVPWKEVVENK